MKARLGFLVPALFVAGAAQVFAQGNISVIPTVSYLSPTGNWINATRANVCCNAGGGLYPSTFLMKANSGLSVGLIVELGLSKQFSLAAQVGRSLGGLQKTHADFFVSDAGDPTCPPADCSGETDMTTTNLGAMLIIRPLGRTPTGAPRTLYLEVGGGINYYDVSRGFVTASGTTDDYFNFSYHTPTAMAGIGFSFPLGRRVSLQLFGRGYLQTQKYNAPALASSSGVLNGFTDTSGKPFQGQKPLLIQIGAGLRVGR